MGGKTANKILNLPLVSALPISRKVKQHNERRQERQQNEQSLYNQQMQAQQRQVSEQKAAYDAQIRQQQDFAKQQALDIKDQSDRVKAQSIKVQEANVALNSSLENTKKKARIGMARATRGRMRGGIFGEEMGTPGTLNQRLG